MAPEVAEPWRYLEIGLFAMPQRPRTVRVEDLVPPGEARQQVLAVHPLAFPGVGSEGQDAAGGRVNAGPIGSRRPFDRRFAFRVRHRGNHETPFAVTGKPRRAPFAAD
jgi:hypothetical protein